MLNIHESTLPRNYLGSTNRNSDNGLAFVQAQARNENIGNENKEGKPGKCFYCKQPGHWKNECPVKNYEAAMVNMNIEEDDEEANDEDFEVGTGLMQCSLFQRNDHKLNKDHLSLDTCATFSQVLHESFLSEVQTSSTGLMAYCNAGTSIMHKFGYMGKLKVWVNPKGLANILSFHELERHYEITYGSKATKGAFIVHTEKRNIVFKKNEIGLPYIDTSVAQEALCLINTVRDNYKGFTKKEIARAKQAREALAKVGNPTERNFTKWYVTT